MHVGNLHLVYGRDAVVSAWVAAREPTPASFGPMARAIGVELDGAPVAGVVFTDYRRHDITLHVASTTPRWLSRRVTAAVFGYVFMQLGCLRCTGITGATNTDTRRLMEKLGFVHEGTHPLALDGREAAVSYGLLRQDCRWIPKEFR